MAERPTRQPGENFYAYMKRVSDWGATLPPPPIENQRPDLIRSDLEETKDQIRSDEPLGKDEALALARSWGLHDGNFKTAIRRMSLEWVIQQINFVAKAQHVTRKGPYLSSILARNTI